MLSHGLETFTMNHTSIHFLQSTSVRCDVIVLLSKYNGIRNYPLCLAVKKKKKKKTFWVIGGACANSRLPGPLFEEERPGIEAIITQDCVDYVVLMRFIIFISACDVMSQCVCLAIVASINRP